MAAEPKPPYKLTIKLDGAKPERIMEALTELREKMSEHDQTGEAAATMTIEGWQEQPLLEVLDSFETWLFYHAAGVDSEVTLKRPGVRPETIALLAREKNKTPMDAIQGFAAEHGAESVTLDATTRRNAAEMLDNPSALFPGQEKTAGETTLDWLEAREQRAT